MKLRGVFEKVPGSGVWWIQFWDASGRRRREKAGSKSNAILLYTKRWAQALGGKKLPETLRARTVTIKELADDALTYSRREKLSYKADVSRMQNVLQHFGIWQAESVGPTDVESWLDAHEDWTLATRNRHIALLKLVYRLAERNKKITMNPMRLVRQRKENNGRVRYLTMDEEIRLRLVIEEHYPEHLCELEIALHTGMRSSEQYGMRWEDVDLDNGIITVPRSKNGETRYIDLNSHMRAILGSLQSRSLGIGPVFSNRSARHWFEPAVRQAGLVDFTWHCLRHSFASRLVMAGIDLRTVQEAMGHKNIQMTCRYAHLARTHRAQAMERLVAPAAPSATTSATGELSDHGRIQ